MFPPSALSDSYHAPVKALFRPNKPAISTTNVAAVFTTPLTVLPLAHGHLCSLAFFPSQTPAAGLCRGR